MRLLMLSTEFPPGPGGIGTHAYQLALNLRKTGWDVAVLTSQDYVSDTEIEAFNRAQPFQVVRFASGGNLVQKLIQRTYTAMHWLRTWKPDVVIGTGARQVWVTAFVTALFRKPWLAVGHGTEFGFTSSWQKWITRRAFQQASVVVCVSQFTRQYMVKRGIRPRRDVVIPNGADSARFYRMTPEAVRAFRSERHLPDGKLLITVGNVTERKGQDVVIRALPHVLQQIPDVHYLIAGLPTNKEAFGALASQLGVADHVHFLGRVEADQLPGYLNTADLFVMTSRHTATGDFEGYGIAVIEAALCSKPAVVSADSGLAEAVIHNVTGLHVPQNDERAAADAIATLLMNDHKRQQMGESAYQRAISENTWEHVVHQYHEQLQALVRKN